MCSAEKKNGSLLTLIAKAKAAGAAVKETDSRKLDQLCGGAVHQGVVAVAAVKEYAQVEDIFALAADRGGAALPDRLRRAGGSPQSGAVIRTAECAGAHGVIIPKRRSVGLTYAVGKASAGAVEHLPVASGRIFPPLLDELKEKGRVGLCRRYGRNAVVRD